MRFCGVSPDGLVVQVDGAEAQLRALEQQLQVPLARFSHRETSKT